MHDPRPGHRRARAVPAVPAPPAATVREPDRRSAQELVDRCLANRSGAWEEFLRRYGDLIYSTLVRKVGLPDGEREDAFQGAVVSIYENLPRLRDPDRLVPWIVRIAYNQGVNRLRARTRLRETPLEDVEEGVLQQGLDSGEGAAAAGDQDATDRDLELAQRARDLMAELPPRCRRLLALLFYQDPPLDYVEIARREGMPIGGIGPTRARCLEKMRRLLMGSGGGS